jgi:hypothetical protein
MPSNALRLEETNMFTNKTASVVAHRPTEPSSFGQPATEIPGDPPTWISTLTLIFRFVDECERIIA